MLVAALPRGEGGTHKLVACVLRGSRRAEAEPQHHLSEGEGQSRGYKASKAGVVSLVLHGSLLEAPAEGTCEVVAYEVDRGDSPIRYVLRRIFDGVRLTDWVLLQRFVP